MRKFFMKMAKPLIIRVIKRRLTDDKDIKKQLIEKINARVDIPVLDEAKEAVFIEAMYTAVKELTLEIVEEL